MNVPFTVSAIFACWAVASASAQTVLFEKTGPLSFPASTTAGGGDVNGDGRPDFIVVAGNHGPVEVWSGANGVLLYSLPEPQPQAPLLFYGQSVADAGDVNGDGFHDIAVGAPLFDEYYGLKGYPGKVFVFSGATGSLLYEVEGKSYSAPRNDFGVSVDGIGDINGDGFDDLVVGDSYGFSFGSFVRAVSGLDGSTLFETFGGPTFGGSVSRTGDVDNDGIPDFIVSESSGGAPLAKVISGRTGLAIYTFTGSGGEHFGVALSGGFDANADGTPDLIVGQPGFEYETVFLGKAYLYSGADGSLIRTHSGPFLGSHFGQSVLAFGDVSGDGYDDYMVCAPSDTALATGFDAGTARLYSGKTGAQLFIMHASGPFFEGNHVLGNAGDVNGDGLPDAVIGIPALGGFRVVSFAPGLLQYGPSTAGCSGSQHINATKIPKIGEAAFALTCTNGPVGSIGLGLVTDSADINGSDPFGLGVLLAVDLFAATEILGLDFIPDTTGFLTANAPIPHNTSLIGKRFYAQALSLWPGSTCVPSPLGLSTSQGLAIIILPP